MSDIANGSECKHGDPLSLCRYRCNRYRWWPM